MANKTRSEVFYNQSSFTILQTDTENITDSKDIFNASGEEINDLNNTDKYTEFLLEARTLSNYINCGIIFLCVPFILVGNSLTILSVFKFRPLQTVMNMYIVSLAFADLFVGFPTIPFYILFYLWENANTMKYLCLAKYFWVLVGMPASILNLLIVTTDRFVAVKFPLHYTSMMTKKRAKCLISLVWIYSVGSAAMPLLGLNTWKDDSVCLFWSILPKPFTLATVTLIMVTCLPIMVIMYAIIFHEIKKNKKKMSKYKNQGNVNTKTLARDSKKAKLMGFVFLTFVFFWLPFCLSSVLKHTNLHPVIAEIIKTCTISLCMSNSMINPIIYCWIRPDFRSSFKFLIGAHKEDKLNFSNTEAENNGSNDGNNMSNIKLKNKHKQAVYTLSRFESDSSVNSCS